MQDGTEYRKDYSIKIEVLLVKHDLGLGDKDNSELTDEEIRLVAQIFGMREPDTRWGEDGKPIFGKKGIDAMLTIALYVFPWFYSKYNLSQFN